MRRPSDMERVRANTPAEINWRIDRQIEDSVRRYAGEPKDVILRRVWELEREWDIERVLQLMASSISLSGILMTGVRDKRWIVLPIVIFRFYFFMRCRVGALQCLCSVDWECERGKKSTASAMP